MKRNSTAISAVGDPFQVMIVDDSAVIRGFLQRYIEEDPSIKVVESVSNGQFALDALQRRGAVDVVVLDIEMPVMDGLTALPLILKTDPCLQVIIASTLTKENAAITLRCLESGAAECLAKPTAHELSGSPLFKQNLIEKIKALGAVARKQRQAANPAPAAPRDTARKEERPVAQAPPKKFSLRTDHNIQRPEIIAIGSSTGGPQALLQLFSDLKGIHIQQPILITQHMPPTFTTILAEHITKQSGLTCVEASEGMAIAPGHIYIAPGNYHMTVKTQGGKNVLSINQDPPENFCRPSVDPMLRSMTEIYGRRILAIILTGMGSDGLKSCQSLAEAGGTIIAQDETTSVVWGMPGSVAMAGICSQVLPLGLMPQTIKDYANRPGGMR